MKILAINPGMISTKIGVFIDEEIVMHACINHPFDELCRYPFIMDEFDYRKESIVKELEQQDSHSTTAMTSSWDEADW